MIGDDVLYLTATELGERLHKREFTSEELTLAYLDRSRKLGPQLNAYATLTPDRALEQARAADRELRAGRDRGPLHGIPYAAKDLLAVKGYPTTWGAKPYAAQQFDFDATVIQKLDAAGAVLLGTAAMIELAGGMGYRFASASLTGAAKNPWNPGCWTCGSSSGSAAIVSAALAAFAIGTETWGSIVCPSSFTGITGLRPTYGRVSRHGAMALAYSMDKIGPMARSAEDCASILVAISGHDRDDPASLPAQAANFGIARSPAAMKIGWLTNAWKKVPPEIDKLVRAALDVLKSNGCTVVDAALPDGPWEPMAGTIVSVEGAQAFESLIRSGKVADLADPDAHIGGYVNETIGAADFLRCQRIRRVLQKKIDAVFTDLGVDVLAAPSLPATATPLEADLETSLDFSDPLGGIGNACGLPAISVPCGIADRGLPAGIQFVGRALDEHKILAAARLFQAHTDFHRRRPPLS